jgi:CDP-diacylglycerol--serine O-phosphatidyltransferase
MKRYIPNTITSLSLICGCIAIVTALRGELYASLWLIILAAVFDFADGLAARILKAYSAIGKELDSLADLVSFGVAPAMMLFRVLQDMSPIDASSANLIPYLAFAVPVFSALRLAKFNTDDRQTSSFLGLPVPAHALFWAALLPVLRPEEGVTCGLCMAPVAISAILTSILMVTEIPMFSFKMKSLAWKGNELRYVTAIAALLFLIGFGMAGIAATILLYVILSVTIYKKKDTASC